MSSIHKDPSKGLFTRLLDRVEATGPSEIGTVRAGEVVGDFKLVELLGLGGMRQVWAAEQLSLCRRVALKLVLPERVTEQSRELFAREARAGGRYLGVELVPTAIQRVVDFYAAWQKAAPTEGHDKRAAAWRARLSKWKQEQGQ